ncbi:MAG TPA: hypothetical protein VEW48_06595 [Thermoanaerobaculia bacterium]|nr:hypothetical protein [Thermoanaerobaculia bacterium]
MYEPLLDLDLPAEQVSRIDLPRRRSSPGGRRVVIVTEIYGHPGGEAFLRAERNLVRIVQALLRTGKVGLILVGDHHREVYFNPHRSSDHGLEAAAAWHALQEGRMRSLDFIERAFLSPDTPLFGIADDRVQKATDARHGRLHGLREAHRASTEIATGLLRRIVDRLCVDSETEGSPEDFHRFSKLEERLHRATPAELFRLRDEFLGSLDPLFLQHTLEEVSLPVLRRFRRHVRGLERRHLSPHLQEAERLLREGSLFPLIAEARRLGVDLEDYPALRDIEDARRGELVDPSKLQREWQWLRGTLVRKLTRATPGDLRGLTPLLEKAVREGTSKVLRSDRPLHDCAQQELAKLLEATADDFEENERAQRHLRGAMFDLASLIRLDDREYATLRGQYRAVEVAGSVHEVFADLESLRADLGDRIAGFSPAAQTVHEMKTSLELLDNLLKEKMTHRAAEKALARPPQVARLAEELEEWGIPVTAVDHAEAALVDRLCLPPSLAFYEACGTLAESLVDRVLETMSARNTDAALLLCGGFYVGHVRNELTRRDVLCSVVQPRFDADGSSSGRSRHPHKVREASRSAREGPNVRVIMMDRLGHRLGKPYASVDPSDGADSADVKRWMRSRWQQAIWEDHLRQLASPGAVHECRVCKRKGTLEQARVVCLDGYSPDLVLSCPECPPEKGRFLCAHCAGRQRVPFLPGHAAAETRRQHGAEILVCNLHGVPLGEAGCPPRILAGGLPGHTLLG